MLDLSVVPKLLLTFWYETSDAEQPEVVLLRKEGQERLSEDHKEGLNCSRNCKVTTP
jgi:hypothetical protein